MPLYNQKDWPKWAFIVAVLAYIFVYAPYGINDTDGGFIKALSYRLSLGQSPYTDFIYVRPPMSVFQHYIEMFLVPENYELIAERIFFYIKMALINYWAGSILVKNKDTKYLWILLGFVVSVHNYAPAAWHTIDGIIYAVLAVFVFLKSSRGRTIDWGLLLSSFFVVLSVLSKQSFLPLVLLFPAYVFIKEAKKKGLLSLCFIVFFFLGFYVLMNQYGLWEAYTYWTSGATEISKAINHGLLTYGRINPIVALIFLPIIVSLFVKEAKYKKILVVLIILGLILTYLLAVWKNQDFYYPESQIKVISVLAIAYFVKLLLTRDYASLIHRLDWIILMAIAGMVSLSWGLDNPILFSLPMIFGFSMWYKLDLFAEIKQWVYPLGILLIVGAFAYGQQFVYRDGPRKELTKDLSKVFPKAQHIYTSSYHLIKFTELFNLTRGYDTFSVLPSLPLANYLTDTKPALSIDWAINAETNNHNESLIRQLKNYSGNILIEKDKWEEIQAKPEIHEVSNFVINNYKKTYEGVHFRVYKLIKN